MTPSLSEIDEQEKEPELEQQPDLTSPPPRGTVLKSTEKRTKSLRSKSKKEYEKSLKRELDTIMREKSQLKTEIKDKVDKIKSAKRAKSAKQNPE